MIFSSTLIYFIFNLQNIIVGLNNHLEDDAERDKKLSQLADYLTQRYTRYLENHGAWINLYNKIIYFKSLYVKQYSSKQNEV